MYVWVPEVGNTGLVAQSVGSIGRSNPEVVGSNPTEVKFSLTRGDSQIAFKGVIPRGDLVYRQYRLLPAPKHTLKNETQLQTELGKYIFFYKSMSSCTKVDCYIAGLSLNKMSTVIG